MVKRVEKAVPGTAAWLEMAFWLILSKSQLDLAQIRTIFDQLHPVVRSFVFHNGKILRSSIFQGSSRRKPFGRAACDQLGRCGLEALKKNPPDLILYFDAIACAVALMREGHLIEKDDQHFQGHRLFEWLSAGLSSIPETRPFADALRRRVVEVCGDATYMLSWPADDTGA